MSIQKAYKQVGDQLVRAKTLRDEGLRKLKEDFGFDTIEEAEEAAQKIEKWIDKKESQLENKLDKLKRDHPEIFEED